MKKIVFNNVNFFMLRETVISAINHPMTADDKGEKEIKTQENSRGQMAINFLSQNSSKPAPINPG